MSLSHNPDRPPDPPQGPQRPRRPGVCRRCGRTRTIYRRGLCCACYKDPAIRALFPSQFSGGNPFDPDRPGGPGDAPALTADQVKAAAHPTSAPPGSPEKVAIMELRARLGIPLRVRGDAEVDQT